MTQLVPISLSKVLQSRSYTVIILSAAQKNFAIYTEPSVGRSLQLYLSKEPPARPYTHNLMANLLKGLGARLIQVVITGIEDTTYFARLFVEQQSHAMKQIIEIDARPSDCLMLAILNSIPMFCRSDILDKAIAVDIN